MPFRAASTLTFFYALGYPIGALAVSVMSPMAVLVFRFGLAAAILSGWALLARVTWPTGRPLVHVLASGLLAQGLLFTCMYLALEHGAPAVLSAVIISMNPVVTALLAAAFLNEELTWTRVGALVLGVLAVLAACAGRLVMAGGVDAAILLLVVALFGVAAGGVYQQRFCRGVDFRVTAALQNAACVGPVVVLAALTPWTVTDPWKAAGAVAAVVLLNATLCMTLYVRAVNNYGAAAVAMLFAVIPAVGGAAVLAGAGTATRCRDRRRPRGRRGGVLAERARITPAASGRSRSRRQTEAPSRCGPSAPRGRAAGCPCP